MTLAVCCCSHSPLRGVNDPVPEAVREIDQALACAREFVRSFDPQLVVVFAPDHLNGFVYKVMPQFCIGLAATAIGDFASPAGPLTVDAGLARQCAEAVLAAGVDVAVSLDMSVDHAVAQPLAFLFGAIDACPVVPVFINAAAPPRSPLRRSRLIGKAVGRWAAELGQRVLVVGSGGLSHDPPGASVVGASPEVMHRLTFGITPEARATREHSVVGVATAFAAGSGTLRPLAPEFDHRFLELLRQGRLADVDGWHDDWLTENAGSAGHEIRTWIAALAALSTTGPYTVVDTYYRPVPEWIVAFGTLTAVQSRT